MRRHCSSLFALLATLLAAAPALVPALAQEPTRVARPGEVITTGANSQQVILRDQSAVTVGPNAQVKIGGFTGKAQAVSTAGGGTTVEVAKGAFRFVTGAGNPASYQIKTPLATIGVRGTIIEGYVDPAIEILILVEGAIQVCTRSGVCRSMSTPGQYVVVRPNGTITLPTTWPGPMLNINALVNFIATNIQSILERGGDVLPRWRDRNDGLDARDPAARCLLSPRTCNGKSLQVR